MKTLQITFTDDAHGRAKVAAVKAKTTLGDLVRDAVEAHVQQLEAGTTQGADLKGLLMKTGTLAFKIPSATADDASLVLRGLGALVVRAHAFLSGEDDGAFLRDALEHEGETNGADE